MTIETVTGVLCCGNICLDLPVWPVERLEWGTTTWIETIGESLGGNGANTSYALARLGVPVAFVGTVGDDDAGRKIREGLEWAGVDVSELRVVPGARSPQSSVLVSDGTRSIAAYPGRVPRLALSERARELCRAAKWVHADHVGYAAVTPLLGEIRLSLDGGNPIDGLVLTGVDLYGPTEAALRDQFGTPQAALDAGAELVVVTRGADGSVAYTRHGAVVEAPGHKVEVVSTLGAGDVFHGALLAQLVRDVRLAEALVNANEIAAASCRALDGRSAIPRA
jgi:sugar/nucleoside kinase (ribokinase family)